MRSFTCSKRASPRLKTVYLLSLLSLAACSHKSEYDALVSSGCEDKKNCFVSLQAALDNAAANAEARVANKDYFRVKVEQGDYREKVRVDYPFVEIIGAGPQTTRLHFNLPAAEAKPFHRDAWGTPGSATLTINAHDVLVRNIKIENDFDYLTNDARANDDPEKVRDSQAVAVLLDVNSDRVALQSVELVAYQDTLFANGKRAWIKDSIISGNVDFIFGNGQLLIEDSDIISRKRGRSFEAGEIQGHVTAPSTSIKNDFGIVFIDCRLLREDGVPDHSHSLGRPWHPTTTFPDGRYADPEAVGYVAYINCYMDKHIVPQAWANMSGTARDGTKSRIFTPAESRFYEYNSGGPGSERINNEGHVWQAVDVDALKKTMLDSWEFAE